jgi:hypothetical protein
MKSLSLALLLVSFPSFACPDLAGTYGQGPPNTYSIKQSSTNGVTSFDLSGLFPESDTKDLTELAADLQWRESNGYRIMLWCEATELHILSAEKEPGLLHMVLRRNAEGDLVVSARISRNDKNWDMDVTHKRLAE